HCGAAAIRNCWRRRCFRLPYSCSARRSPSSRRKLRNSHGAWRSARRWQVGSLRVARVRAWTQDNVTLSRNGCQEIASLLALSNCPSSKSLPTHLKYSQRNDASGNWYTCSSGTHRWNFLAEPNADMIAGLRSRTLSGHPGEAVRILMLSERLRNLEPRLRSSEAFFSYDFRL